MYLDIWSLAATFFIVPFGPWRQKGYKRVTPLGSFLFEDMTLEG
jgi:hypothetical protein